MKVLDFIKSGTPGETVLQTLRLYVSIRVNRFLEPGNARAGATLLVLG